jgi:putative membrane protein
MEALVHTVALRPYVFAFLAAYLVTAGRDLGWRSAVLFAGWSFAVAWVAEFASTRIGIPFGLYHYTGATQGRELYVSNVPLFDSLSFAFLAYASYCVARKAIGRVSGPAVVVLAGIVMTLLDVVIDPLAVRGERWFLGHLFYYPEGGVYFGVPLSNFVGWLVVGVLSVGGFVAAGERPGGTPEPGVGLYSGVLTFNLVMTCWIGEMLLLACGVVLHAGLAAALFGWRRLVPEILVAQESEAPS